MAHLESDYVGSRPYLRVFNIPAGSPTGSTSDLTGELLSPRRRVRIIVRIQLVGTVIVVAPITIVSHLEIGPGGRVTTHIHPDSEEAMVIVEGSLEAILGDQVVTLGEGDTVLAPAGVKHGFENRSGATARLLAIFPKTQFERVPME